MLQGKVSTVAALAVASASFALHVAPGCGRSLERRPFGPFIRAQLGIPAINRVFTPPPSPERTLQKYRMPRFYRCIPPYMTIKILPRSSEQLAVGWRRFGSADMWKWFFLIIFTVWLAVVSFQLVIFIRKRWWFRNLAGKGRTVLDPAILNVIWIWRRRLHIQRKIEVKIVASDISPFTIGIFRPVVVLPEHLTFPVNSSDFEPVLAHELVHVKRWDDLAVCLQEIVRIVYFFHPLIWFVMPHLTWTREAVCDAVVLTHGNFSYRTYGKLMLASLQRQIVSKIPYQGLAKFTHAARGIAFRIKCLQKEDNMRTHPLKMYLAVLFFGLFLLPMAPVVSSDEGKATEKLSDQTPYAAKHTLPSESPNDESLDAIVNPFDSTCYDWRGDNHSLRL